MRAAAERRLFSPGKVRRGVDQGARALAHRVIVEAHAYRRLPAPQVNELKRVVDNIAVALTRQHEPVRHMPSAVGGKPGNVPCVGRDDDPSRRVQFAANAGPCLRPVVGSPGTQPGQAGRGPRVVLEAEQALIGG